MRLFPSALEKCYFGIPHFMLEFSMDSFLLREYLDMYERTMFDAIILGTEYQAVLEPSIMCAVVKSQVKKSDFDGTASLTQKPVSE